MLAVGSSGAVFAAKRYGVLLRKAGAPPSESDPQREVTYCIIT